MRSLEDPGLAEAVPPHSSSPSQELILLSAKLLSSDTGAEGRGGGTRRKEGEGSQDDNI